MCFSAEASFCASAAITTVGIVAIKKAETPSQRFFAFIPVFFALQQFTEGILWLNLSDANYEGWVGITTYIFLFFAWVIWPVYIPLAIRLMEQNKRRKIWINIVLTIGIIVALTLAYALFFHKVRAEIAGYHIKYTMDFEFDLPFLFGVFYFIPIVFSLFISSITRMRYVGFVALISFTISATFYQQHLISIWCFFAALTSITVLWVVYGQKKGSFPRDKINKKSPSTE